jgi:DNA uptake protein ComE-like DNA-binding protein
MQAMVSRIGIGVLAVILGSAAAAVARAEAGAIAATGPVNLNTATEKQLEDLPGVGPATAKKIIAGRPYASVSDLSKAGVSKATIDKISSMVTVGGAAAAAAAPTAPASSAASHAASKATTGPMSPVNLNTASEKELVDLPGVGPATAKKIIAGRPYASVADLSKAGVSKATIDKIGSMVIVSGAAATAASSTPPPPPPPAPKYTPPPSSTPAASTASTMSATPPSPGMVWANLDSKVYHKAGDRYYGKTKHGQWMTEQQAIAAGYRAAKTESKKTGTE